MLYYIWLNRERNRLCKKNKKTTNMESKQNIPLAEQKREQMPKHNIKKLFTLFSTTLYISAFTFGGGFVIVTFMKRKFVDQLKWIDEKEMLDFTALAQSSPGAIAVNAAILVGWKVCGYVDCNSGDNFASYDHSFGYLMFLCSICKQYMGSCCFKGNAGRSSCCYIGCSM